MMHRVKPRAPRVPKRAANQVTFEETWATLGPAFDAIRRHSQSKLSFEQLWRVTYNTFVKYGGEQLYLYAVNTEQEWLNDEVRNRVFHLLGSGDLRIDHGSPGTTWREAKANGERLLQAIRQQYTDHQLCLTQISTILMRVDRDYCPMAGLPTFHERGTSLFRDAILRSPFGPTVSPDATGDARTLLDLLPRVILDHIAMARAGEVIEDHLIKACTTMLEWLPENDDSHEINSLYSSVFEKQYLESSTIFFRNESEVLLKEVDARSYCHRVKTRILEEQDRCTSSLQERTAPQIVKIVELEMINNKMNALVDMDTGVSHMVENDAKDDIQLMYLLESRVSKEKPEVTRALQDIIRKSGDTINKIVTDLAAPPALSAPDHEPKEDLPKAPVDKTINQQTLAALKWVEDVLLLKDKFDSIWHDCLFQDKILQTALTKTLGDVINSYNRCSEYISLFIDDHMKKGIKGKTEAEVEIILDKAITLVRYLQDKDLFEKYYKKHLCKRLLMGRSLSIDVEKSMIGRMKIELGNSFTTKLEAMFKDMTLSGELTAGYKNHVASLGQRETSAVDLSINVLTSMTWPLETMRALDDERDERIKTIFPPAIERLKDSFAQFYAQRHSGRVLTWQANMGTADIKATFPSVPNKETGGTKVRIHELNVSTYAMIVLVLFNDLPPGGALTYEEICDRTRIPESELKRNLQSLAVAPKTRILLKQPMSKDVKAADKFIFNAGFQGKFVKIKVGVVTAGNRVENDRERKVTENANNDSRGFVIEAAIVRIMKQRKELSHAELVSETLAQLASQFKPDVGLVKKKVEMLIDREYLERVDEAAVPSYRYLA